MASLRLAVCPIIGPIELWVPDATVANVDAEVDANSNAIAVEVFLKLRCRFEILKDSLSNGHIAGECQQIVTRKSCDRKGDVLWSDKCCIH